MREVIIGDLRLPMCQKGFLLSDFGNCAGGWDGTWVDAPRVEIRFLTVGLHVGLYYLYDDYQPLKFCNCTQSPLVILTNLYNICSLLLELVGITFIQSLGPFSSTSNKAPVTFMMAHSLSLSLSFSILLVLGINFA